MTDEEAKSKLKELLSTVDYTEFVNELAVSANDKKIQNLLDERLTKGEPFYVRKATINVQKLHPMQNEIDTTKSLQYPLTKVDSCKACFSNKPVIIKLPLFTFDGKWIVDGHHRWSQVYCINPDANMACFDLLAHVKPINVLKIIQVKIAADTGAVKVAKVEGSNLLEVDTTKLAEFIDKVMTDDVEEFLISQYGVKDRAGVIKRIISNVNKMRSTSQPLAGAPERGVMPQTDAVPQLADDIRKGDVGQGTIKNFSTRIGEIFNKNFASKSAFLIIEPSGYSMIVDKLPSGPKGTEYFEFPDRSLAKKYDELTRAYDRNIDNDDDLSNVELKKTMAKVKEKMIKTGYL